MIIKMKTGYADKTGEYTNTTTYTVTDEIGKAFVQKEIADEVKEVKSEKKPEAK